MTPPKPGENPPILRITNIAKTRLDIYEPAADKKNGAAVVIVPGGGFGILALGHEGADLAEWFRARGFVAGVLQHRCPIPKDTQAPGDRPGRAELWQKARKLMS